MSRFDDLQKQILKDIKQKALDKHIPILKDDSMQLISLILTLVKPNRMLEVGTAVGYSAICFSNYLEGKDSKILSLEINKDMYDEACKNVNSMKLNDKIKIVCSDATKYMHDMSDNEKYDIVFIDAAKGQYLIFLENAIRLIKKGGVIIADNVLFKGMVLSDYNEHKHRTEVNRLREYISQINNDKRLTSYVFNIGDGVAISIKK